MLFGKAKPFEDSELGTLTRTRGGWRGAAALDPSKAGMIGPPMPGVEVKIVSPETGEIVVGDCCQPG